MSQEKYDDLTIFEKYKLVQTISGYPALTLMVFTRQRIGFRMLKPHYLSILVVVMVIFSAIGSTINEPRLWVLPLFAVLMWVCGTVQRQRRWKDLCTNKRWHSYSAGISWLEKLRLPDFFTRDRRLYRKVEPGLWAIVGMMLVPICRPLGAWIILAALFLCIFEQYIYQRELDRILDVQDNLCESEVQSELADHFSKARPADAPNPKLEQTAGIPTGVVSDMEFDIAYRRQMRERREAEQKAKETKDGTDGLTPQPQG